MSKTVSTTRILVSAAVVLLGVILLHGVGHGERVSPHRPLRELPMRLGEWRGRDIPLEQRIVESAGVDDYLNRVYLDPGGHAVGVYIGYYASQRTGDTIHSPKNCLPGAGWRPVRAGQLIVAVPASPPITVNEYTIEKGLDQDLVLYWYQGRGRVVASEYWGKVWLVIDAIKRNRTDGSLVRLFTSTSDGEANARERAVWLAQTIYVQLRGIIPD